MSTEGSRKSQSKDQKRHVPYLESPRIRFHDFRIPLRLLLSLFKDPKSMFCPNSSSAKATCWSWILQYLSETDEDRLIEKALLPQDSCFDLEQETEETLRNFGAPNSNVFSVDSSVSWCGLFSCFVLEEQI